MSTFFSIMASVTLEPRCAPRKMPSLGLIAKAFGNTADKLSAVSGVEVILLLKTRKNINILLP